MLLPGVQNARNTARFGCKTALLYRAGQHLPYGEKAVDFSLKNNEKMLDEQRQTWYSIRVVSED